MLQCETFSLLRYFKEYNTVLASLMSFQYVRNDDIPCWRKSFLVYFENLSITRVQLVVRDPYKEVQASVGFFFKHLCK